MLETMVVVEHTVLLGQDMGNAQTKPGLLDAHDGQLPLGVDISSNATVGGKASDVIW